METPLVQSPLQTVSPSATPDIMFTYNQILTNADLAFSLVYKGEAIAVDFRIITLAEPGQAKACVFWGEWGSSTFKPFIVGSLAPNVREAFDHLLVDSSAALTDLKSEGKLMDIHSLETHNVTSTGGSYDSEPKLDPKPKPGLSRAASTASTANTQANDDHPYSARRMFESQIEAAAAARARRTSSFGGTPGSGRMFSPSAASYFPPSGGSTASTAGTPGGRSLPGLFSPGSGMSSPFGPRIYGSRPYGTPRSGLSGH